MQLLLFCVGGGGVWNAPPPTDAELLSGTLGSRPPLQQHGPAKPPPPQVPRGSGRGTDSHRGTEVLTVNAAVSGVQGQGRGLGASDSHSIETGNNGRGSSSDRAGQTALGGVGDVWSTLDHFVVREDNLLPLALPLSLATATVPLPMLPPLAAIPRPWPWTLLAALLMDATSQPLSPAQLVHQQVQR